MPRESGAAIADTNSSAEPPWTLSVEAAADRFATDLRSGLTREEAARRLEQYGANEVVGRTGPGALLRLLRQFHQPLIYILIVAGVVTAVLEEYVDSVVIFGVVIVNTILGYIQESRALAALRALTGTLAIEATVIRDGERHRIAATEVVPGDLVVIESGDKVPADLRLVRVRELQVEEAPITGESVPVGKQTEPVDAALGPGDRTNMAYSSTLVTFGRGVGVVSATGGQTEVGRISELMESAEDVTTPLTRRINWLSRLLLIAILALAAVTFGVGLLHGIAAHEAFLAAVALAVAAIPEGLPAVITITLAVGVSRMARRRAIIRRLPAVETLGSTTVVCSDKTGTLTQNEMTVQRIYAGGLEYAVSGIGYEPEGSIEPEGEAPEANVALERCLLAGLLCNDAALTEEDGRWTIRGDPTEGSLIVAAAKAGMHAREAEEQRPRIDAVPFESERQYMATLHGDGDSEPRVIFAKGSGESLLARCRDALGPDGQRVELDVDAVLAEERRIAEQGLRVLALAQKEVDATRDEIGHEDMADLTFLGLQGMIDPPRREAIESVRACKEAGIVVKMITGDHAVTAGAIAQQLAIGHPGEDTTGEAPRVVSGGELGTMSDEELRVIAEEVDVFARVPPEGKLRLVQALQSRGHVAAMTGDGVNDGPALRQADIGIAMGLSGTEVAREAGDMVLTDDNFASIEAAIEEGRGVFDNLTKFLVFILPTNLGQSLVILVAILLGATLPVLPVQVLWVNMTTAIFLGLTLALEPREPGIMRRPPRDPSAPLLPLAIIPRMLLVSLVMLVGAFGLFLWYEQNDASVEQARTVAVNVLIAVQVFYLLNCRSLSLSMFAIGAGANRWIFGGIAVMVLSQLAFTYAPPMHTLFHTAPISLTAWAPIIAIAMLTFALVELDKWWRRGERAGTHSGAVS